MSCGSPAYPTVTKYYSQPRWDMNLPSPYVPESQPPYQHQDSGSKQAQGRHNSTPPPKGPPFDAQSSQGQDPRQQTSAPGYSQQQQPQLPSPPAYPQQQSPYQLPASYYPPAPYPVYPYPGPAPYPPSYPQYNYHNNPVYQSTTNELPANPFPPFPSPNGIPKPNDDTNTVVPVVDNRSGSDSTDNRGANGGTYVGSQTGGTFADKGASYISTGGGSYIDSHGTNSAGFSSSDSRGSQETTNHGGSRGNTGVSGGKNVDSYGTRTEQSPKAEGAGDAVSADVKKEDAPQKQK